MFFFFKIKSEESFIFLTNQYFEKEMKIINHRRGSPLWLIFSLMFSASVIGSHKPVFFLCFRTVRFMFLGPVKSVLVRSPQQHFLQQ